MVPVLPPAFWRVRAAAAVPVDVRVQPRVQVQLADRGVRSRQALQPGPHQHRVPGRVGDVGGDQPVAVAGVAGGHRAGHAGGVGRHRVGHVAGLQVGEGGAVGHDVLQGGDVRVVDGRLVHVGQDAAGHRVPDLRAGVARGADAVLAGQVEVRHRARAAGGGRRGLRGGGWRRPPGRPRPGPGRGYRARRPPGRACAAGAPAVPGAAAGWVSGPMRIRADSLRADSLRADSLRADSLRAKSSCVLPPMGTSGRAKLARHQSVCPGRQSREQDAACSNFPP